MGLNTGTIINKRYRIVKLLGQGGFGAVYRGWDTSLQRPCAIKENLDTSPEAQRQFLREATTLANLSHPTLPRVTDHFILQGQGQYLVMDFVAGEDLESLIARQGAVAPQQALDWIVQVANALDYLHSQSQPIIHRDIKPANIILIPNGRVMLVDFGLVKVYDPQLRTTSGARAVTPGYSPPEQYGHGNTDARTDIYALAATLYTLLTGREPQESVQRIVQDALATPSPLHPQIPPEIGQVIRQAMSLSPSQRYQSAEAFTQGLLQEKTTVLPPSNPPKPSLPKTAQGSASSAPTTFRSLGWGSLFGGALILVLLTAALLQFALWPAMRGREAAATSTVEAAEIARVEAQQTATRIAAGTATSEAQQLAAESTSTAVRAATNVAQDALRAEARATGSVRSGITATANANATAAVYATGTARREATAIANANATAVVSATRTALEAGAANSTLIFGPEDGSLDHEEDNYVESHYADVSVRDFVAEAQFVNPYSASAHAWDYGFLFRHAGSNQQFRLTIDSNSNWDLRNHVPDKSDWLDNGSLSNLNLEAGETNWIRLVAREERGLLYVNNEVVADLDLSLRINEGDVMIATGIYNGYEKEGEVTEYRNFTVRSFP